eukprot:1928795-Pleurochrysis_carterae.AAC.1
MSSISSFRHRRNLGDATIKAALASTTFFADIVASTFEAANTVTSIYNQDRKARTSILPFSQPQRRLLGIRKVKHTCSDGRKVESEVYDYCFDQPMHQATIQRFLRLNPEILADPLREEVAFDGTVSDLQQGSVYRQHPLPPNFDYASSSLHLSTLF